MVYSVVLGADRTLIVARGQKSGKQVEAKQGIAHAWHIKDEINDVMNRRHHTFAKLPCLCNNLDTEVEVQQVSGKRLMLSMRGARSVPGTTR